MSRVSKSPLVDSQQIPNNAIDLRGQPFGRLVVQSFFGVSATTGHAIWLCLCECGKEKKIRSSELRSGNAKSCGCRGSRYIDRSGERFGRLTVINDAGRTKRGKTLWNCLCDCGEMVVVRGYLLASGATQSCGCLRSEISGQRLRTHGKYNTPEYRSWSKMIRRCTDKNCRQWKWYGGRGITVCTRWANCFDSFLKDVGCRPSKGHSLDRFPDRDGNYEPGNVRWATQKQQMRNTRANLRITYRGETRVLVEWSGS